MPVPGVLPCKIFKGKRRGFKFKVSINCSPSGLECAENIMATLETWYGYFQSNPKALELVRTLVEHGKDFPNWPKDTAVILTLAKKIRTEAMLEDLCSIFEYGCGQIHVLADPDKKKK